MVAVIMAGGKGTRLSSVTGDRIPKPMVPVDGKPLLEHQIDTLIREGIREFIFVTGYMGNVIRGYFGNGNTWGCSITYIEEEKPLGTAGALYFLKGKITEDFLMVFGDIMFDIDIGRFAAFHRKRNGMLSLYIHPNSHPYDSDLVILGKENEVLGIVPKNMERNRDYRNLVNAGIYMVNPAVLQGLSSLGKLDMEKDIVQKQVKSGGVFGYAGTEYVRDIGTPERLAQAESDVENGTVRKKNLRNRQKAIFLDRDGTVNKYAGLINRPEQMELEEGAARAIREINASEYLAVLITNQPVVARGMCSVERLEQIHNRLETLLGKEHAYLDGIFYCPHHPDRGYPEEDAAYKVVCKCRKPKTGLLQAAAEKYNIDLSASWMVGDTTVDIQTGKNAGMKTVLLGTGIGGKDRKYSAEPYKTEKNLYDAVCRIIE